MRDNLRTLFNVRPYERHSLVLSVGGLVYIFVGLSFIIDAPLSKGRKEALYVALQWLPISFWSFLFIFGGVLAVLSARWPTFSDSWGYIVLTSLSSGWATVYFMGFIFGPSVSTNIHFAVIWGLLAFMWWAISGLVNPERRRTRDPT